MEILFFNHHNVMNTVVIVKILHEALPDFARQGILAQPTEVEKKIQLLQPALYHCSHTTTAIWVSSLIPVLR